MKVLVEREMTERTGHLFYISQKKQICSLKTSI